MLLGLALIPFNTHWVLLAELRWANMLTLNPLFVTPVFCLFVLVGINTLLRRYVPRVALSAAELIVVYLMMVVSCTVATHDYLINLMSIISWPAWTATPENRWEQAMFPHLPRWLYVWDKDLLRGFYHGNSSPYDLAVLKMWFAPLAFWSLFIFTTGWICLCLNVLIRRAWTENSRLTFPIVQLPLALTEESPKKSMVSTKTFRAGFAVALGLGIVNGFSKWFPNMPHLPTNALWLTFNVQPWATISPFSLSFYPFVIGLAFLVPLDISFSLWFFYLLGRAQMVLGYQHGQGNIYDFSFISAQSLGAWIAFGVALVYGMRGHLRRVLKTVMGYEEGMDAGEPMSYRLAFWGFLVGAAAFALFWREAGMSVFWVLVVLVAYVLLAICFTRIRAEAGCVHETWDVEPMHFFRLFDWRLIGPANLAVAATQHWFWRMGRSHFMPNQLEAFKLAEERGISLRKIVAPLLLALVVATVAGMWSSLHILYTDGATAKCAGFPGWTTAESFDWLGRYLAYGQREPVVQWWPAAMGVAFVAFLSSMRARFVWFPFHPFGYCLSSLMHLYWFPFLIAWALKFAILRYGGFRLYRAAVPFFLGLVLGDYFSAGLWSLVGIIWQVPVYGVFH